MSYVAHAFDSPGLAAVWYASGEDARLSGVAYDDGGRLRTLMGLGQDPTDSLPPDVGLDPTLTNPLPIDLQPVSPTPMLPFIPSPVVDTTSISVPSGGLIPPSQQAAPITGSILTDLLNAAKTIVPLATGASTGQATPQSAGTIVTTGPGASTAGLTSTLMQDAPTIGMYAAIALAGLLFIRSFTSGGGGGSRKRKNPAELILMGANPRYGRRRR